MNKRQAKKMRKKVVYPVVDEMNLLTLSQEEYEVALKDFHKWVQKHCRYKHYKDKEKLFGIANYHFPVGEGFRAGMEAMIKRCRTYNGEIKPTKVTQELVRASGS